MAEDMKLIRYIEFYKDYLKFKSRSDEIFELMPCVDDKTGTTSFDRHYIYHPAWAMRKVLEINPKKHVDISSILYFSAMLSSVVPVEFYDYRPAKIHLNNLEAKKADLMSLPFEDNSIESLSCMHTVEHIGLGRYGDTLNPEGDKKAISELKRVVKKGGSLLLVVPVGKPKVVFNAHRIYEHRKIMEMFDGFDLKEFVMIPDKDVENGYLVNPAENLVDKQEYACGCYWFVKKK